jgi:type VI secretion system protein VasD
LGSIGPWRVGASLMLATLCLVLVSLPAEAAKTVKVKSTLTVAQELNPDYQGRSSPVNIIVFQLSSADAFSNADFFSLYDPDAAVLGDDLLGRTQLLLQPGEEREWTAEFDRETRFIGVIAAYRDIENAEWRATVELPTKGLIGRFFSKNKLRIVVDTLAISVSTK